MRLQIILGQLFANRVRDERGRRTCQVVVTKVEVDTVAVCVDDTVVAAVGETKDGARVVAVVRA